MAIFEPLGHRSSFGSVYKKRRRDGSEYDGWFVRFVEGGRRVERFGGLTKDIAETFLAARRLERSRMRALGLADIRRVTVQVATDEYLAWVKAHRRAGTWKSVRTHLKRFASRLGAKDVVALTTADVAAYLDWQCTTKASAPATLHLALAHVGGFCKWAISKSYARDNPARARGLERRLPRIDQEEPPYLSPAELRIVFAAVPPEIRTRVVLMAEAGLRRTESVRLRWRDLRRDFSAVSISGDRSKGHRARTVPLTAAAQEALRAELAGRAVPIDSDERVFPLDLSAFCARFDEAMEKIGRPEITPKTLRHAFGSGAAMAGVDLEILRRLMGHRSIKTTMKYACHRPKGAEEQAIRSFEESLRHTTSDSSSQARKTS